MEKLIANQFVIYENDAVLVSYRNGAGLQLAPCGSVFNYYHPLKEGEHPLHGQKKVLQRTQYVTSTFKDGVVEAVDFRNRFAQLPYLCKEIISQHKVSKLHADVCEIAWPENMDKANIQILEDNSIMITSLCTFAKLTLVSSRQQFSVEFLCRVSQIQEKEKWTPVKKTSVIVPSGEPTGPGDRVDKMWKYCVKSKDSNMVLSKENPQKTDTMQSTNGTTASIFNEGQWDYTWVAQHFSVQECPKIWQHPLNLAQEAIQKQRFVKFQTETTSGNVVTEKGDGQNYPSKENSHLQLTNLNLNEQNEGETSHESHHSSVDSFDTSTVAISHAPLDTKRLMNCVFSSVPKSLPINCLSSHLHKWGSKEFWDTEEKLAESGLVNGRIKVIFARGIIYRFLWKQPKAIEIYPGDGTVLRTSGLSGHFFTHHIYNATSGKVEEKMYSIEMPPPDIPGAKYSIARLVKTGERYLRHLYEESLGGGGYGVEYCCWKVQPAARKVHQPLPNVQLEECVVPGVGKFTAQSSGRVRIVFSDRTALDMYADFSKRLGHCKQHSEDEVHHMPDLHSYQPKSMGTHILGSDLPQGVCRLMLPNGHYQNVILSRPDLKFQKYIRAAQEWVSWVNCSPNERYDFYKDTLHDSQKAEEIDRELKKINCFNYIVEKTVLSQFETKSSQREMYLPDIQQMEHAALMNPSFNHSHLLNSSAGTIPNMMNLHPESTVPNIHQSQISGSILKQFNANSANSMECHNSYFPHESRNSGTNALHLRGAVQNRGHEHNNDDLDTSKDTAFNLAMVEQILQKTSQAVTDLDKYLKSNGEEQTARD